MANDQDPKGHDAPAERLPYEPPAVISEEVFETLALGCNKTGTQQSCRLQPPAKS